MARGRKHGQILRTRHIKAKDLKPVLMRMKRYLRKQKVPKVRLPANDLLVSYLNEHLEDLLDWKLVDAWLNGLAASLK